MSHRFARRTKDEDGEPGIAAALRRAQWSIAVVAGLAGAIAVHLIFVGTFLPDIVASRQLDSGGAKALIALSDALGAAIFFLAAAPWG